MLKYSAVIALLLASSTLVVSCKEGGNMLLKSDNGGHDMIRIPIAKK